MLLERSCDHGRMSLLPVAVRGWDILVQSAREPHLLSDFWVEQKGRMLNSVIFPCEDSPCSQGDTPISQHLHSWWASQRPVHAKEIHKKGDQNKIVLAWVLQRNRTSGIYFKDLAGTWNCGSQEISSSDVCKLENQEIQWCGSRLSAGEDWCPGSKTVKQRANFSPSPSFIPFRPPVG